MAAPAVVGMHPIGMHSWFYNYLLLECLLMILTVTVQFAHWFLCTPMSNSGCLIHVSLIYEYTLINLDFSPSFPALATMSY